KILTKKFPDKKLKFYLIGDGSKTDHYKKQIDELGLTNYFEITGRIPFNEVSEYHNLLDIFLNVSIEDSESFGVAAVEAMACEKPVVVSNVGGLKEVVSNGEFGIVVAKENAQAIADAIESLLNGKIN